MRIIIIAFFLISISTAFAQNEINIVSDEQTIHLKTFGEGEPLLIINGGPGMNSEGFIPLAKTLGESYKAIIYDQRGTGRSLIPELSSATLTMDLMVEDMETIRKHLKIESWAILGHSFGGMLGAYYTARFPERVNKLILSSSGGLDLELLTSLNITAKLTPAERDSLAFWNNKIATGDTTFFAALQRGKYLAPAYLYDKSHVDAIAIRLTQGNRLINTLLWQNMRDIAFDCKAALSSFPNPVLIIHGEQDILDSSIAEKAHAIFENSSLLVIPQCAHYAWLEQPDIYFKAIHTFLESKQDGD